MKLIKIPFNAGALSKKNGQELAPDKITSFLKEVYMNESGKLPVINQETISINNSNVKESLKQIETHISDFDIFTIILGGDHSITYSCFKSFAKHFTNPGIVVFDAHPDVQDDFKVSHEDYLRVLINENHLKPQNIVLVGIRNWSKEEIAFLQKHKIKYYTMKQLSNEDHKIQCDEIMSIARTWDGFYLSIDIDVLDPAFAPGTGYAEPGGMSTRELLYFIQRLKLLKNLKAVDIVEVNPTLDLNDATSKVAAKLVMELA